MRVIILEELEENLMKNLMQLYYFGTINRLWLEYEKPYMRVHMLLTNGNETCYYFGDEIFSEHDDYIIDECINYFAELC